MAERLDQMEMATIHSALKANTNELLWRLVFFF